MLACWSDREIATKRDESGMGWRKLIRNLTGKLVSARVPSKGDRVRGTFLKSHGLVLVLYDYNQGVFPESSKGLVGLASHETLRVCGNRGIVLITELWNRQKLNRREKLEPTATMWSRCNGEIESRT